MTQPFNLTKQNMPYLIAKLEKLDPTRQWQVIIRESKTSRSIEQNERLWKLYESIGGYIGEHKDEVHKMMKNKFLKKQEMIAGELVTVIGSTKDLNVKQMAEYQENIERWARDFLDFVWQQAA